MRLKLYRGSYYAVWSEGGETRRRSLRTKNRSHAVQALEDFKRAVAVGSQTVGEIMAAYLTDKQKTADSPERLGYAWKAIKESGLGIEDMRPDQIDRELCRRYATVRRGRVQNGTIIKELTTLKAAVRWFDPQTRAVIEMPASPPPQERHLSRDEARALIAGAGMPHIRLFIVLALTTAARKEALMDLEWSRVDFERGLIRLAKGIHRSKGRATVPMHDLARPYLLDAKRAAVTDFVIEYAERPVKSVRTGFRLACERANLRGVTPHVLRHSSAVWMAEAGVSMPEIAAYLGHTSPSITARVYAKFSPDYLRHAGGSIGW